jgi:hypothetical protein
MANPELLVCDSDVLAQLFIVNQLIPLRHIKENCGIQPVIVEEVDVELRWLQRYRDRFVYQLERAIKSETLILLDKGRFQSHVAAAPVGASWESFQTLGQQYEGRAHRGEAYTFAAALTLGSPALSNDYSAVRTLQANFLTLPAQVLRTFDLISFCFSTGALTLKDCEEFRSKLSGAFEGIPAPFQNASFENGLKAFRPRLLLGSSGLSTTGDDHAKTLQIITR